MGLLKVHHEKCDLDGICVEVCPIGILDLDLQQGPKVRTGMGHYCIACGHCVAACPHGALDNVQNPLEHHTPLPRYPVLDPQTALTFLRSRRSIRCYKDEPVPRETLLQLLDAARYAPSGHNSQALSYIIVQGPGALNAVCDIVIDWMRGLLRTQPDLANRLHMPGIIKAHERGEDRILRKAPQIVVATAPRQLSAAQVTTYLALEYVELYATAFGLGTCWGGFAQVCAQQQPALAQYLRVPEDRSITGILMVGYPKHAYYRMPERNPLEVAWHGEQV